MMHYWEISKKNANKARKAFKIREACNPVYYQYIVFYIVGLPNPIEQLEFD